MTFKQKIMAVARFWPKVDRKDTEACWTWLGATTPNGYGSFRFGSRSHPAHRVSYILSRGDIPPKYYIDHTCRNRLCVNPNHLRTVTPKVNANENTIGPASRTHCKRGHEYTPENTRWHKNAKRDPYRICRKCANARRDRRKEHTHEFA